MQTEFWARKLKFMGQEATQQVEADVPQEHGTYPNCLKMFEEEHACQKMSELDLHGSRDTQSWVGCSTDNYPNSFFLWLVHFICCLGILVVRGDAPSRTKRKVTGTKQQGSDILNAVTDAHINEKTISVLTMPAYRRETCLKWSSAF